MDQAATNGEQGSAQPGSIFLFAVAIGVFLALLAAGLWAGELAEVHRNGATL